MNSHLESFDMIYNSRICIIECYNLVFFQSPILVLCRGKHSHSSRYEVLLFSKLLGRSFVFFTTYTGIVRWRAESLSDEHGAL